MARYLARPLALPSITRFEQLFRPAAKDARGVRIGAPDYDIRTGRTRQAYMTIGPFLSIRPGYESLGVRPREPVIDAIVRGTISVAYDVMSFEITVWDPTAAVVIASHSKIIGSVWLAVIDPLTIPGWAPPRVADILRYARGTTSKKAQADAYRVAADAFREEEADEKAEVLNRYAEELAPTRKRARKKRPK